MSEPVVFRGLRGRTLDDQKRALENGYESLQDYAIDELGQMILELRSRVEALEQRPTQAEQLQTITDVWDAAGQGNSEGEL